MSFPTRKAALAAAAALCLAFPFALAACGGGGGTPAKPTAMQPDPAPAVQPPDGNGEPPPAVQPPDGNMGGAPELRTPLTAGLTPQMAIDRIVDTNNEAGLAVGGADDDDPHVNFHHQTLSRLYTPLEVSLLNFGLRGNPSNDISNPVAAEENLRSTEAIFNKYYTSLEQFESQWPNIFMAQTMEHCTKTVTGGFLLTGCSSDSRASLDKYETRVPSPFGGYEYRIGSEMHLRKSTVGYLDYSAFFLNKILTMKLGLEDGWDDESAYVFDVGHYGVSSRHAESDARTVGIPTREGTVPTATWKGGMIGMTAREDPCDTGCKYTFDQAIAIDRPLITGDVTFSAQLESQSSSIEFSNVVDSEGNNFDGWEWDTRINASIYVNHLPFRIFAIGDEDASSGITPRMEGTFYGPSFEEMGGTFHRPSGDTEYPHMIGAFGAKRQ